MQYIPQDTSPQVLYVMYPVLHNYTDVNKSPAFAVTMPPTPGNHLRDNVTSVYYY